MAAFSKRFLLLSLLVSFTAIADDMRWAGWADTHYGAAWTWGGGNTMSNILTYVQTNFDINFVVLAGDVGETQASGPTTCYTNYYDQMITDWQALTVPYYPSPGNHDLCQWVVPGTYICWTNYFPQRQIFTNGNYVFIGLGAYDSGAGGVGSTTNGAMHVEDVYWADNAMSNCVTAGYTNFITFEHYPLILDGRTATFGTLGYTGRAEFTNLLSKYHVIMNLHGHTHDIDATNNSPVPNTLTIDRLIPSPTRSGPGLYEVFFLTNTTLRTTRWRWDNGTVVSNWNDTVPLYISNFTPPGGESYLPCDVGPKIIGGYSTIGANSITINWPGASNVIERSVQRRIYTNDANAWNTWTSLYDSTTAADQSGSYTDNTVSVGVPYEYELGMFLTNVVCNGTTNSPTWYYQYICTGIQVPVSVTNGYVELLVESGVAASLATELATLTNDLVLSGYRVFRHDVAADDVGSGTWSNAVIATRTLVTNDYASDRSARWSLFIVGHVPIPYSGDDSPGSHTPNLGAHPADWFYAITNASTWTDTTVNDSTGDYAAQHNVPNDGKFDQDFVPAIPVMTVGRVDFRNIPAFTNTEVQLLKRYLDRDHAWRSRGFTVRDLGIINSNNNGGLIYRGQPYEEHSVLASLFGTTNNTLLASWLGAGSDPAGFLTAASAGNGNYDQDEQIGYTTNFMQTNLYVAFCSMYGSFYGDWDSSVVTNCVLWGPLASDGYTVNNYYRENVMVEDSPSLGGTMSQKLYEDSANLLVGSSKWQRKYVIVTDASTNTIVEYLKNYISLLGDPTLTLRTVIPASSPTVHFDGQSDNAIVNWTASTDTNIVGYYVYRAPSNNRSAFVPLTPVPTNAPFTDIGGASASDVWWVRAVKREVSDNRSFDNVSIGVATSGSVNTNYYVAKTGNDSNPGTLASPFLTIQHAANLAQAGDAVYVGSGIYAENVRTDSHAGASGEPIVFDGQGVATVGSIALENPYINFQNFTVKGGTNLWLSIGYLSRTAHFCIVSNNIFDGNYDPGLSFLFRYDLPVTGPWDAASQTVTISNTFTHGYAVPLLTVAGSNNVIYGNNLLDSDTADFFRPLGLSNVFSCNVCSNNFTTGASGNHPDCFQVFGAGVSGAQWITIASNLFVNSDSQICMTSADDYTNVSDFFIYNNKFIGVSSGGINAIRNMRWYNNLFYECNTNDVTAGPVLVFTTTTNGIDYTNFVADSGHGGQVYNNVFLRSGDVRTNNANGWYYAYPYITNFNADFNYVGKTNFGPVDPAEFTEANGINGGDPHFVNYITGDFRVGTNSILFNAGTNLTSLFMTDLVGVSRPPTGNWTMGPLVAINSDISNDPFIVVQPQNQTVVVGGTATFTVIATGNTSLHYQWLFNEANVGTDSDTYVRSNCQIGDNAAFVRVQVIDDSGTLFSDLATLTVTPAGSRTTIGSGSTIHIGSGATIFFGK